MKRLVHPILMLLAGLTEEEPVQAVECPKAENRILRSKLRNRVAATSVVGRVIFFRLVDR
jgi:hypothetical protein